jgi:hypothetical protein
VVLPGLFKLTITLPSTEHGHVATATKTLAINTRVLMICPFPDKS